jgi:uncharacterized protein
MALFVRLCVCLYLLCITASYAEDYKAIKQESEKACDMGDAGGCFNLGFLYYNGYGVRQNMQTAKELFGKACDLGEQMGCDNYRKLNQ